MATLTVEQQVQQIYIGLLGRAADKAGLDYWTNEITTGVLSIEQLRANIVNEQPEYADGLGLLSRAQVVSELYQNLFERAAESAGLNYWVSGEGSSVNIDQLVLALTNAAGASDRLALDNKTEAATYYAANVGTGFTRDGAKAAVDSVDGTRASVLDSKAATDGGTQSSGDTFTLTTGIDTVTGTSNNDTINGTLKTAANADGTFSALDTIDGGAGTDTLIVNSLTTGLSLPTSVTVSNVEVAKLNSVDTLTADVSSWTGLTTANVKALGATGITAAATTDVNELTSVAASTITGGKDVTVVHTTTGDVTAEATAGALNVTSAVGDVAIGGGQDNDATTDAKGSVSVKMGATAVANAGVVFIDGGTAIDVTATNATTVAIEAANTAANTAAATAANTAEAADDVIDTQVLNLAALTSGLAGNTGDILSEVQALTAAAYGNSSISRAEKVSIDAAFVAGADTAASQVATAAIAATLTASVNAAKVTSAAAETAAKTVETAANAVVTAANLVAGAVDNMNVTATQNTALTSVSINSNDGAINVVTDASTLSNTLATVSLNDAGAATLTGSAIATVNLTDQSDTVAIVNATAANTVAINANGVTGTVTTSAGDTKTINLTSTGTNTFTLTAADTTALNISGAGSVTLGSVLGQAAAVINASAATGDVAMEVAAGQAFTGGSGNDTVTTGAALQTAAVAGGAGTDTLVLTDAANYATTGAAKFSGFETLQSDGVAVDVSKFTGSTITAIKTNGGSTFTALNATQAANVTAIAGGGISLGLTGATTVGQLDTVNIDVNDGASAVNTINLAAPVLAGVETINLTATDNTIISALTGVTALTNLNVTGAGTVDITSDVVALNVNSVIDASAVDSAVVLNFLGGAENGISLKAGDGNNTLTGTDIAGKGNAIVSGDGNSTLTGGQADDVITAGNGNNTVVTGAGANTVTAGNGDNAITGGAGVDTITVGNGYNTITAGAGDDVISVGSGGVLNQAATGVTGGAGNDAITYAAHAAGVFNIVTQGLADSTVSSAQTFAGGTIAAGDTMTFGNGVDTITGFGAANGDLLNVATASTFATLIGASALNSAGGNDLTADTNYFASGAYNATTGVFTFAANGTGADTLVLQSGADDGMAGGDNSIVTNDNAMILVGVDSDDLSAAMFIA